MPMNAILIVSNLIAWSLCTFCVAAVILTRRTTRHWHARFKEKQAALLEIEFKNDMSDADHRHMQWLKEENSRLSLKCSAICRAARRMKGRGKSIVQCDPMHNF